ncbi:unannotated protein [freshwater metagenome]|uniref:Unannotated protein n=1 Tax=freshwater metagenome TaxID=449393 RepID=A0A6J6WM53_9ZZZZ
MGRHHEGIKRLTEILLRAHVRAGLLHRYFKLFLLKVRVGVSDCFLCVRQFALRCLLYREKELPARLVCGVDGLLGR